MNFKFNHHREFYHGFCKPSIINFDIIFKIPEGHQISIALGDLHPPFATWNWLELKIYVRIKKKLQ